MVALRKEQARPRTKGGLKRPGILIPEERLDVVHIAGNKTVCLGCGYENPVGKRFCEVCGRIVVA